MDAIAVSTPDHWHAEPVIAGALAGKDIYVQKPLSMTLVEGRAVSDTVRAQKRAFQIGSQQRSTLAVPPRRASWSATGASASCTPSRSACPWTRPAAAPQEMPVPPNLNYEMWLGCTPQVPLHRGPRASAEQHQRPARLAAH